MRKRGTSRISLSLGYAFGLRFLLHPRTRVLSSANVKNNADSAATTDRLDWHKTNPIATMAV